MGSTNSALVDEDRKVVCSKIKGPEMKKMDRLFIVLEPFSDEHSGLVFGSRLDPPRDRLQGFRVVISSIFYIGVCAIRQIWHLRMADLSTTL